MAVLAREMSVSERTAYRDIGALRAAGHDIQATSGVGGGVRIAPDSHPRPAQFEVSELIGLALSLALSKTTAQRPFAQAAEAALDRALGALAPAQRRAMRHLHRRILIGRPASAVVLPTVGAIDTELLSVFEQCFTGSREMAFDYVDWHGAHSSRRIECVALMRHEPAWHVLAWDLDKDAPRVFRMDRITHARVGGGVLASPHPLDVVIAQACPDAASYAEWMGAPIG